MTGKSPTLSIIEGDLNQSFTLNGITLRLSAMERRLPPQVQALVVEQDTSLLLDESLQLDEESELPFDSESTDSLAQSLLEENMDYPVGSVFLRAGSPASLLMIIHDLNANPSWDEEGIHRALNTLFAQLPSFSFHSLALPALAHRYGPLPVTRFLSLLCEHLTHHRPLWEGDIWLLLPRHELQAALETLHTLCDIEHN